MVYTRIYGNRDHMDLCLQGSGDLHMCGSQMDRNIAHSRILLFLDDLLMFYQAFGVNLSLDRCGMFCCWRGLRFYSVYVCNHFTVANEPGCTAGMYYSEVCAVNYSLVILCPYVSRFVCQPSLCG